MPVEETCRGRVLAYSDAAIFSGAESVFCDVLEGIARDPRFELVVAAPPENAELRRRVELLAGDAVLDVPAQPPRLAAFRLFDPRRRRRVGQAVDRASCDLVFVNLPSPEYGASPLLTNRASGLPMVGLMHVSGRMDELGFRFGGARVKMARRALRRLDRLCVLSEHAAGRVPDDWGLRDRDPAVVRLPRPSVETIDAAEARRRLGLPEDVPVIGIAGRLTVKQKGQDLLAEAAPRILARHPDAIFAVAGEGQDRELIQDRVDRLGIARAWRFLGQVRPIGTFLSAVDLIAMPSRFEGLPLIGLEALLAGVPGIATPVDGIPDVWPEAWQVPADDSEALATGILKLMESPGAEIDRLVEEGRERVRSHTLEDASADVRQVLGESLALA